MLDHFTKKIISKQTFQKVYFLGQNLRRIFIVSKVFSDYNRFGPVFFRRRGMGPGRREKRMDYRAA